MNKILYFLFVFTIIFLSGCWDMKNVDELNYVSAIGLDEVEGDKVKLTFLVVNPSFNTTQNAPSATTPFNHVTFLADDFFMAKNIINTIMSNQISYVILKQIFVSEELAKQDKFIHWIYDTTKDPAVRRDMDLIVTKEKAETYLKKFKPKINEKPHQYFIEKSKLNEESGFIPFNTELLFYFRTMEAGTDLFLATYSTHGDDAHDSQSEETYTTEDIQLHGDLDKTQYLGAAVFKNGKMIGTLSGTETLLSSILHINFTKSDYYLRTFPDPFNDKYTITTRLNITKRSKIKMYFKKAKPTIQVTLPITMDVITNHAMIDYARSKENRDKLTQHLQTELEQDYHELIKKTQKEFGSDPFGWSLFARRHFPTTEAFESFNWMEKYPSMDIDIDVHVKLGNFGRQPEVFDLEKLKE